MNSHKRRLARLFEWTGLNAALLRLQARLWQPHVRIVNYHDVPTSQAAAFESQLVFFATHFAPVSRADLEKL